MASAPIDPLQTLQAALNVPANSKDQADLLAVLRQMLEKQPAPIPILAGTLISVVRNAGDSLLKRWILDLFHFAICRSTLSLEQKTQMSSQALDTLAQLIDDPNPATVKVVIQCFSTIYPLLFRFLCTNRTNPSAWHTLESCRSRIASYVTSSTASLGVKLCAVKFLERFMLVGLRGVSDPRLANKHDPSISMVPAGHPFIDSQRLERDASTYLENMVQTLFTSRNVDMLTAIINGFATWAKLRPAMSQLIVGTFESWTPNSLQGLSASAVKSVEKSIRILLMHLARTPAHHALVPQINNVLATQGARMEHAAIEEKRRKAAGIAGPSTSSTPPIQSAKRPGSEEGPDAKRQKLDHAPTPIPAASTSVLASFDFTTLPHSLITDLIVANLEAFSEADLINVVRRFRDVRAAEASTAAAAQAAGPSSSQSVSDERKSSRFSDNVKDEAPDPLQMDIDQDEMEYEPDRLNEELSARFPSAIAGDDIALASIPITDLSSTDFTLPPPEPLTDDKRLSLVENTLTRIWDTSSLLESSSSAIAITDSSTTDKTHLWMLLVVRMITRVAEPPRELADDKAEPALVAEGDKSDEKNGPEIPDEASAESSSPTQTNGPGADKEDAMEIASDDGDAAPSRSLDDFYRRQDQLRQTLCTYIMRDFPSRVRLASTWMNEEWYNDKVRIARDQNWRPNYATWLNMIVVTYQSLIDGKDKTFSKFLLDLPHVPPEVIDLLRDMCVESESMVGFLTLRGYVTQRPSIRSEAIGVLLDLTTHPNPKIRGPAINSVKAWVPNMQPMDDMVRTFALQLLRKLSKPPSDQNMDEPEEDLVQTPYLPARIELPAENSQVLQHMELLFALSVRDTDFLDEIFSAYCHMDVTVQEAVQSLITALIRSLIRSSQAKLLTLLRTCPPGAESLALRVLTIFTEDGRPSPQLVALVKGLISERDLDARFLIPVIAEMDKADIIKYLPRIVSILNGKPEPKALVRSVFQSVVSSSSQTLSNTNAPRVRQSELLGPAELMVMLHEQEKEIGLKSAIEAIGICFSMTDVFRSEILGVVIQQIMDESVLPVLFLRTVIQAVTTYKSLVGFVSTTLLSRLIIKKIWTNPPLWEGFIRCAKVIAPASFGALLQLPREQLRELVDKQPGLKSGLRDYVTKKAPNKARVAGFLDIFGEVDGSVAPVPSSPAPGSEAHVTNGDGVQPATVETVS